MPKGFKPTSSQVTISGKLAESGANTYTEEEIDLQLSVLDKEVFVVTAVDINCNAPQILAAGTDTEVKCAISTTSRSTVGDISNSNVLGALRLEAQGHAGGQYVAFDSSSLQTPPTNMEYIGIISTNNFYASLKGNANNDARTMDYRVYGYRARVSDASIYAALVQSELLSSDL